MTSDVRARAGELWRSLRKQEPPAPAHADATVNVDRRTPLGRAAWNVLLVLEDRAPRRTTPATRARCSTRRRPSSTPATGGKPDEDVRTNVDRGGVARGRRAGRRAEHNAAARCVSAAARRVSAAARRVPSAARRDRSDAARARPAAATDARRCTAPVPAPAPPPQASAPPPAPSQPPAAAAAAATVTAPASDRIPMRFAIQTEAAIGVYPGDFYNHLAGVRLDLLVLAPRQLRRLRRLREPEGQGRAREQRPALRAGGVPAGRAGRRPLSAPLRLRLPAAQRTRSCGCPPASPSR